jgi:hypothetical protein
VPLVTTDPQGQRHDAGVRFGVLQRGGCASIVVRNGQQAGLWHFDGARWTPDPQGLAGLELDGPVATSRGGRDGGVRLRDLDGDGGCELVVGNGQQQGGFAWSPTRHAWSRLPFGLPQGTAIVDAQGRDAGLRFVDIDEDGRADVVFSDARGYSVHLFVSLAQGWSRTVLAGLRDGAPGLPAIVRADGTNNGAWFKYRHMWVQNEDTGKPLPRNPQPKDFVQTESRHYVDDILARDARRKGGHP